MRSQLQRRILEVLQNADHPLWPKEISRQAQVHYGTTRVYLRQLLQQGRVKQTEPRLYVMNPMYGVGEAPPLIQNVILRVRSRGSVVVPSFVEQFGDVTLKVSYGMKRGKITCALSCPRGMDLSSFAMAVAYVKHLAGAWEGVDPTDDEIEVVSCEFLNDYQGMRLEGVQCITLKTLLGALERIYNKGAGLRSEVKVKPQSLEAIYTLLKGGVTAYNVIQGIFAVDKRIEDLTVAIKHQNLGMQSLTTTMKALLERWDQRNVS